MTSQGTVGPKMPRKGSNADNFAMVSNKMLKFDIQTNISMGNSIVKLNFQNLGLSAMLYGPMGPKNMAKRRAKIRNRQF